MGIKRKIAAAVALFATQLPIACYANSENGSPTIGTKANTMNESSVLPGFIYSRDLVEPFGLEMDSAIPMCSPLLGAALETVPGPQGGHLCKIHLLISEGTDIRLPDAKSMNSASAASQELPISLIKKASKEIRNQLGSQVRQLSNRNIVRFGEGELEDAVSASEDKKGSYVSLPLDSYDKKLLPDIMSVVIPINCALAAADDYDNITVFFEYSQSPEQMIISQSVDPATMTAIDIPIALFNGMRDDINKVLDLEPSGNGQSGSKERYRVITDN